MKKIFQSLILLFTTVSIIQAQSKLDKSSLVINNGDHYTKSAIVELEINAQGAIQMMISNDKGFSFADWITFEEKVASWELSEGDGEKDVYLKLKDESGNVSKTITASIVLDTQRPLNPMVSIYQGEYMNDKTLIVDLHVEAEDAQFVMISNTKSFYNRKWQIFRKNFDGWELAPGEDGVREIYVKFKDAAQNESEVVRAQITVDTQAPFSGKVVINNGDPVTIQQDKQVKVNIFARGADSVMVSQNETFEEAEWEPYQQGERTMTLEGDDGKKMVYTKFKDNAGNVSQVYSDDIFIDTTPPRDCSIVIDGGADATNHYDKKVTLTLKAEGAYYMKVSNMENFYGAKWQRYSEKIGGWSLDGEEDGEKSVFVKFKDKAGNVSPIFSDAILLKRTN